MVIDLFVQRREFRSVEQELGFESLCLRFGPICFVNQRLEFGADFACQ